MATLQTALQVKSIEINKAVLYLEETIDHARRSPDVDDRDKALRKATEAITHLHLELSRPIELKTPDDDRLVDAIAVTKDIVSRIRHETTLFGFIVLLPDSLQALWAELREATVEMNNVAEQIGIGRDWIAYQENANDDYQQEMTERDNEDASDVGSPKNEAKDGSDNPKGGGDNPTSTSRKKSKKQIQREKKFKKLLNAYESWVKQQEERVGPNDWLMVRKQWPLAIERFYGELCSESEGYENKVLRRAINAARRQRQRADAMTSATVD